MNRKVLGGVVALVVVLVGVWFLWLRDKGDEPAIDTGSGDRKADIALEKPKPTIDDSKTPTGRAPQWMLDVDPDGPLQLEGQVLGPDGKGVGGAEVWLASVPPRSVKSEDDGTFAFDKLVGRTYQLTASAGDLIGGPVSFKLTEKSDPVVIRLTEGATVTVSVVDEAKQPLASASVKLGDSSQRTAQTDAKGEATLKPVRPGYVAIQASANGFAPNVGYATVGSAGGSGRVTITLRKGFAVSGRVTDETGAPIAKVRVSASGAMWGDWMPGDGDDNGRHDITTDAKGQFAIPALASGSHTLIASERDHAPAREQIQIEDRPLTDVVIVMKSGGLVAGKVVDTDGKPVPYATVRIAGSGTQMWSVAARQATTDKAGTFELRGLTRSKLAARAESSAAASKIVELDFSTKSAHRDVTLVLDVTGLISGIVVDDKGAPVPEVQVNAFPDIMGGAKTDGVALAGMSSATSDGAGLFAIRGLPESSFRLWAARASAGNQQWGQQGVSAKTGDKNVRITLAAGGELVGTIVIDGATAPPKQASVQVGYQAPQQTTDGKFAIKDVAPGSYTVTFRGPEFAELAKHEIKVEPGKTTDLGKVTVNRGRRLAGKVVDGSGAPVAGAKVKLAEMLFSAQGQEAQAESWEEQSGVRSAVSDADGEFAIVGVPRKATNAMADHGTGRSLAIAIPEGTDDPPPVTLALRGFGSISGRVVLKGQPQANVTISESSKGGGAQASFLQTDDKGNFTMRKVTEGAHVLYAMQNKMMSMKSTSVTVNVASGRDTKVTIDIPVGQITLAVNVKPRANAKVDAAQVFLFAGMIAPANAKQLTDTFFEGGVQGMKFWFGAAMPSPEFEEVVPGDYTVCTIPITGPFSDPSFQQQLQANMQTLKVYCKQVRVTATPLQQSVVHEVPAMDPLPKVPPS